MVAVGLADAFLEEFPRALKRAVASPGGHVHRELTVDGKAELLRYVRTHAIHEDLIAIVACLRGLRFYLGVR